MTLQHALRKGWRFPLLSHPRHFLPQAERSHIGPDVLDIRQACGLEALLAYLLPAERRLPISRPYGVLLFVIDHNLVDSSVFCIVPRRGMPPMTLCMSPMGEPVLQRPPSYPTETSETRRHLDRQILPIPPLLPRPDEVAQVRITEQTQRQVGV